MDIQAYISSGKLELFVLGDLNETERREVLSLAKEYPEIQREIEAIEALQVEFDQRSGGDPSKRVKAKIFDSLEADREATSARKNQRERPIAATPWKSFAVAASVTALLAIGLAGYFAYRYFEAEGRVTQALAQNARLAENLQNNQARFEQLDARTKQLLAGDFTRIPLNGSGLPMQEAARVDVFWDPESQAVFLSVNQLAELDEDSDYQLWAIGADGPEGIGLVNPGEKLHLQIMEATSDAQAFAITIEPKGGSAKPTLENLVVLGEVS
ncbi:anti-sigma factor domain-containing protein [Cyclobacterium xiamenense]|uniref:anti-sigma factor n=1 Tax=Cyclobacterium xiamenense TaxID=1297121 RepID=UPI0035D02DD8